MQIKASYRDIWGLSSPLMIAGVSDTIFMVTDTIFLGKVGMVELGAIAIADAIYVVFMTACSGISEGIEIIVSRNVGEADYVTAGRVFNQGLLIMAGLGCALFVLLNLAAPPLIRVMITSEQIRQAVWDFLAIMSFGCIVEALILNFDGFYVGVSKTNVLMVSTLLMISINIALDYVLIFGNFGAPEMGIAGAALASVIAAIGGLVFLTVYARMDRQLKQFQLFSINKWSRRLFRRCLKISTPMMFQSLLVTASLFLLFIIIEQLGEYELAISNIVYNCFVTLLIPIDGLADAANAMASNLIGQGKSGEIDRLARKSISLGYMLVLPFILLALVFPGEIIRIFTPETELVSDAIGCLFVLIFTVLIVLPGGIYLSLVSGTGDTRACFIIQALQSICLLTVAWLAAFKFALPLEWIWSAEAISWLVAFGSAYAWLKSGKWVHFYQPDKY